ncbi:MAG: hypothetical protein JWP02_1796 [Acidimicrobiales bacterium]|nr:hypothetical protein [Acidimicrobiales bacterium]
MLEGSARPGWDDRLLSAAADLAPDWVLCLEGDEGVDISDAQALRSFVATDALPGCAYSFQRFRVAEGGRYDPSPEHVYRLFAYRPRQRFRSERGSDAAVPDDIPRRMWVDTSLRIQQHVDDVGGGSRLWSPRPTGLGLLGRGEVHPGSAPDLPPRSGPSTVVCLLPARNCEADLPGWFESVSRFADAVVALDDGSTDDTGHVLEAEPLVKVLLTNVRRESHVGWDDSANRNRLLEAAADLDPYWIVSLDADERIPADDAVALRSFLEHEAQPDHAYAFGVHRMIGDAEHYDRLELFALRAFAYEPGQRFRSSRFHFAPVPTSIPESRWVPTSIRIQHLAAVDEGRRRARWSKYREVDPDRTWEPDYGYTLRPPGNVVPWPPRVPGQAVVMSGDDFSQALVQSLWLEGPDLSVVVLVVDDDAGPVELDTSGAEVLIVVSEGATAADMRAHAPDLPVIEVERGTSEREAQKLALQLVNGDYVLFLRPGERLGPGAEEAVVRAHQRGHAMVGGTTVNLDRSVVGWASYLLDHAASLPGGGGPTAAMPPARCSYARAPLMFVDGGAGDVDDESQVVNHVLARWSFSSTRVDGLVFVDRPEQRGAAQFIGERFRLGRALGRALVADPPLRWPGWAPLNLLRYVPDRVGAVAQAAARDAEVRGAVLASAPLAMAGLGATVVGAGRGALEHVLSR